MARRAKINTRRRNRRIIWISVAAAAIVVVAAAVYIAVQSSNVTSPLTSSISQPVASNVLNALTGVSDSTLSTIGGPSSISAPKAVSGTPLSQDGKPEILYIGGEYCPYCAFERWSMVVALSRFGTFSGLQYMLSSSSDPTNPNTPTFTFVSSSYTSPYVSFVPIEEWNRAGAVVTTPSTADQALFGEYDADGSIPFLDIGNSYVIVGAQSSISLNSGNWTSIAGQLNDPSSQIAQAIDGGANYLISAICRIDGAQPSSVCGQSYADLTLAYSTVSSQSAPSNLMMVAPALVETRWAI